MPESQVPAGCGHLLAVPPPLASTPHWQRHGHRFNQVVTEVVERAGTEAWAEAQFCRDLSLRLWEVVSFRPFALGPGDAAVMWTENTDCRQVSNWLWSIVHSLKARAFALDPDIDWPGPALTR